MFCLGLEACLATESGALWGLKELPQGAAVLRKELPLLNTAFYALPSIENFGGCPPVPADT